MAQLPLLVAGPIVRRVEPGLVAVWVATSKACKVRVDLFLGPVDGNASSRVTQAADFEGVERDTIEAGKNLHVAVALVRPPDPRKLVPDQLYSYNVVLTDTKTDEVADLGSLGLLTNAEGDKPHLALGFNPGRLPSFSLAPLALEDLVLIHGSCRRAHSDGPDAMAFIDDLIERNATKPRKRPHLLVLTGDQIYADDVSPHFLKEINDRGRELVDGVKEDATPNDRQEHLPIFLDEQQVFGELRARAADPADDEHWKLADLVNFPIGKRTLYCDGHARFTSSDREQHLLSFGEFAAIYVLSFSNALWSRRPDPAALTDGDDVFQELMAPIDQRKTRWLFDVQQAAEDKKKADAEKKRSPEERKRLETDRQEEEEDQKKRLRVRCRIQLTRLREFYDALPRVRRALANVPTFMMFDDHEITDDWNIVQRFKHEVYARPAGRAIVRNGLIAYALFQAWGNNPLEWSEEAVDGESSQQRQQRERRTELLEVLRRATVGPRGWGEQTEVLDELLGLHSTPAPTHDRNPPVRWHYRYRASRFELIALDSRTRRFYPGPVSPPGLIDARGLGDQIPGGPADSSIEAVLVLAACPVIGPSMMDELIQPAALHVLTMMSHLGSGKVGGARLRERARFLDKDPESWSFDAATFEKLLARLEAYAAGRPVLFLSGDVHYGTSAVVDYWKGERPTRFIQLTASAFRNQPGLITVVDPPLAQRVLTEGIKPARLGWKEERPVPYTVPDGTRVPSSQIRNLNRSPLLLAADGWPEGTRVTRAPDWAWRYAPVLDQRPEENDPGAPPDTLERRPAIAANMPAPVELPENVTRADFDRLAERHALHVDQVAPRRVVFSNNMGVVRFAPGPDGPSVRHEIHYQPRVADPAQGVKPHTVFVIGLATPSSATPPTLGAP